MRNNVLIRTALNYGSMCGASIFLFYLFLYFSGANLFAGKSALGAWIPVLFIVLATKHYRERHLGGAMTYGQGFAIGSGTSFFSALLFGLLFYLLETVFDHSLLDAYKTQAAFSLEEGKGFLSEKLIDTAMATIDDVTHESLAFSESFNKLIWGVMITLITAGVMKKDVAI